MRATRGTLRTATVVITETRIDAHAPATAAGFGDLVILLAAMENKWREGTDGLQDPVSGDDAGGS